MSDPCAPAPRTGRPSAPPDPADDARTARRSRATSPEDEERPECVQCRRPTEYPATRPGAVLCPVCEWQEGQRTACSG